MIVYLIVNYIGKREKSKEKRVHEGREMEDKMKRKGRMKEKRREYK